MHDLLWTFRFFFLPIFRFYERILTNKQVFFYFIHLFIHLFIFSLLLLLQLLWNRATFRKQGWPKAAGAQVLRSLGTEGDGIYRGQNYCGRVERGNREAGAGENLPAVARNVGENTINSKCHVKRNGTFIQTWRKLVPALRRKIIAAAHYFLEIAAHCMQDDFSSLGGEKEKKMDCNHISLLAASWLSFSVFFWW